MPIDPKTGIWSPTVFPKQADLLNSKKRFILAAGPRYCGKSIGVEHKIVKHMWHTPGARVCAVSKTVKAAKHGGSYTDLLELVIPEWQKAELVGKTPDIQFGYTVEPKIDGSTRAHYFKLRNWFGGDSEFYLFSLDYDDDVEKKFKQTRFSAIWFIELSNFGSRTVFDGTIQQLRMPHLRRDQHLWIADTNPADDGPNSWIYRLWFEHEGFDLIEDREMLDNLEMFDFKLDDNIFADKSVISDLKATYRHNASQWARFIDGRWVSYAERGHFKDHFKPEVHVIGKTVGPKDEWDVIVPEETTTELLTGWDIGSGGNSAAHIIQKRLVKQESGLTTVYDVISELVSVGNSKITLDDFVGGMVELMERWEKYLGKQIQWKNWSDSSAWNFDTVVGKYQWMLVKAASDGKIELRPCPKYKNSVRDRVGMLQKLLSENRIYISASCTETMEMIKNLQRGKSAAEYVRRDQYKHPFDSLTYAILPEESFMISKEITPEAGKLSRVVSVEY